MRILGCEICSYKKIVFGDLIAKQLVVFEHKRLFGILFFYFKGGEQDRFHTHAFNAISFKLFGSYTEGILNDDKEISHRVRKEFFRYFPRNSYHSINKSKGCMTLLIQGPWKKTWKEYKNGKEVLLTWHRKEYDKSIHSKSIH